MQFTKAQGLGDDFIIIEDLKDNVGLSKNEISKLCRRHFGIGANGLILLRGSNRADYCMNYFNPNGESAEMCGDGLRCLALYLHNHDLVKGSSFEIETLAGTRTIKLQDEERAIRVSINMGQAIIEPSEIPLNDEGNPLNQTIEVQDREFDAKCLSVGNPHCVIEVADVENFPVTQYGPALENSELFPEKANVEFVEINNSREITMRTWERNGHGEPFSCGSGSSAAVAALSKVGVTGREVTVHQLGGDLQIRIEDDERITMEGSAKELFTGTLSPSYFNNL